MEVEQDNFMSDVLSDVKKKGDSSYETADNKPKAGRKRLPQEEKKQRRTVFFTPEQLDLLNQACEYEALEDNTFIIRATIKEARRVIAEHTPKEEN